MGREIAVRPLYSIQAVYDRAATIACLLANMCTAQRMSTLFLHCTIFIVVSDLVKIAAKSDRSNYLSFNDLISRR
jgi:hypothetical protein